MSNLRVGDIGANNTRTEKYSEKRSIDNQEVFLTPEGAKAVDRLIKGGTRLWVSNASLAMNILNSVMAGENAFPKDRPAAVEEAPPKKGGWLDKAMQMTGISANLK